MISNSVANLVITGATAFALVSGATEVAQITLDKVTPPPIEGQAVMPDSAVAGQDVLVKWVITKRTACPGENSRVWDGEDGFHLTERVRATGLPATGVPKEYNIQTRIPEYAPIGLLSLRIHGWYQCPGAERVPFDLGPAYTTIVGRIEE